MNRYAEFLISRAEQARLKKGKIMAWNLLGGVEQTENELSVHDANTAALFTNGAETVSKLTYADPLTALEFLQAAENYANSAVDWLGNQAD